ncbi:glutathione S-transferase family protein [Marinobacter sp. CHS3-4]|uniref:glutathione S-transferase family protein n=1 Tax=Marinobacter sp. CHS3-4 TaxID=3045174 RepID=UPI0024B5AC21|nr:glutathione S-transferase family protein [Marinobacter sp. CHS3-4]MDI9244165.1 glutathione S-transferase family protein [Marinobacter sp. CHS3-4]
MALKLYQFAISHFCEKARWALDFKGLNYQSIMLLPGQHVGTMKKLGADKSSVPVLVHDGQGIQGSARILDYLDETFPERPLTPSDPTAREKAIDWERRMDEELGPAVRCYAYHYFLQRPKLVTPLLTAGTPFYNRFLVRLAFSRVDEIMRKWMKINDKTADAARQTMERYLTELTQAYEASPWLAGDSFSRADLTAAAFFAPLFQPPQYPVPWPDAKRIPEPVRNWLDEWKPQLQKIEAIYTANR